MAARVELARAGGELRLTIADDGVGFDPNAMRANGSLGLVSMSERARFVHGQFSIESHAGKGTLVEVWVPIAGVDESLLKPMRTERAPPRQGAHRGLSQIHDSESTWREDGRRAAAIRPRAWHIEKASVVYTCYLSVLTVTRATC